MHIGVCVSESSVVCSLFEVLHAYRIIRIIWCDLRAACVDRSIWTNCYLTNVQVCACQVIFHPVVLWPSHSFETFVWPLELLITSDLSQKVGEDDWSRNSSNSVRLVEVARKAGCNNSQLMHSEKEIPFDEINNSKTIGISSGASAPEKLVQNLINQIKKDRKVSIEEIVVAEEKVIFKLPKELN